MDYEKAYKAVLQTATQWIKDGCTDKEKICLECVFPELRESEDERIRKHLVAIVEMYWGKTNDPDKAKELAYLEKQKEKSEIPINVGVCSEKLNDHSEWNDFEIRLMDCMLSAQQYRQGSIDLDIVKQWAEELSNYCPQPNQKWSEFDWHCLERAIWYVENPAPNVVKDTNLVLWLKSLRPSWKPSDKYITPNKEFFRWIYDRLINVHKEEPNTDYMISFKKRIEELSFDKSSWKPSEEQMSLLDEAISKLRFENYGIWPALQSLKNELKKLM